MPRIETVENINGYERLFTEEESEEGIMEGIGKKTEREIEGENERGIEEESEQGREEE